MKYLNPFFKAAGRANRHIGAIILDHLNQMRVQHIVSNRLRAFSKYFAVLVNGIFYCRKLLFLAQQPYHCIWHIRQRFKPYPDFIAIAFVIRFCLIRNFFTHIRDIRIPVRLFIAQVMHRFSARKRNRCRPQRVIRRRNKYFIAVVKQSVHRQCNQLTDTVSRINVIDTDIRDIFLFAVFHNGIRIAFRIFQITTHHVYQLLWCFKTKRCRISDI